MGYRHSKADILAAAVEVALESGMTGLTFNTVGARLGISDRTVVYYFPSKPELVVAVAAALGADLQDLLGKAFGDEARSPEELVARSWPVLTSPTADRVFALYFEIVGLASAGQAPFDALAGAMVEGWVQWLTPRVKGSTADVRRRRALATVAQIDGLLLLRRVLGPDASAAASVELARRR